MPFGPDISWPNGFRQLDSESRRLLESGYATGGYVPRGYETAGYGSAGYGRERYDQAGRGNGNGAHGYGAGSGYQQSAMDDYGDPGYSDPSYDGPRNGYGAAWPSAARAARPPAGPLPAGHGGHGRPSGAEAPDYRQSAAARYAPSAGIDPLTGAQEALPWTSPQPVTGPRADREAGSPQVGSHGYPGQRHDSRRPGGWRPDAPPASDPRLEGMRYDELRYDEELAPGYDDQLDDVSWYEELRRSAPVYPERHGGPAAGSMGPAGLDQRPAEPQRRGSGPGQQPGYPQAPGREHAFGYGRARDERGGPGPTMSASGAPWTGALRDRPLDPASADAGYLGAPAARVGVLTPPATVRLDTLADDETLLSAPAVSALDSGALLSPPVRPGHGLDGPEITSSWPAQPQVDDLEAFEDFWRQDEDDDGYPGLFPDEAGLDGARDTGARRRTGRRRGRSRDHRLWLALAVVVVAAAAAIFGIIRFEFPAHGGPAHAMAIPDRIGTYLRTTNLEKQANLGQLRADVIKMSAGQATGVVSAVYESGDSAAGSTTQIIMLIEGHLANADPAASIASFTQKSPGAVVVSPGTLGGKAACVEKGAGTADPVSMCVWFDNDSFGEIVSPTMNATTLSTTMLTIRPSVELVVKK